MIDDLAAGCGAVLLSVPAPSGCRLFRLTLVALASITVVAPPVVSGQVRQQPIQTEYRLDAIFAHTAGAEAALGLSVPAGLYVRTGLVAGIGVGAHGAEGRTDLFSRFSLDPFRQSRWAPYAGAGISGRYRSKLDGGSRAYLLVFLGVEGPLPIGRTSGIVPAFEVGLGGGARVGVIFRRGINGRR
ncbi:MAG TPA: hypothetical protein VHL32_03070 [Gemmatimonadaceae bacterium]|jgi:hypothetical protein|nr:hypothetical protein [Gemmatimonadaceae bacterium]